MKTLSVFVNSIQYPPLTKKAWLSWLLIFQGEQFQTKAGKGAHLLFPLFKFHRVRKNVTLFTCKTLITYGNTKHFYFFDHRSLVSQNTSHTPEFQTQNKKVEIVHLMQLLRWYGGSWQFYERDSFIFSRSRRTRPLSENFCTEHSVGKLFRKNLFKSEVGDRENEWDFKNEWSLPPLKKKGRTGQGKNETHFMTIRDDKAAQGC